MKTILALLLLSVVTGFSQMITNTVKVTLSTNDDTALRLAWKLDNNARTNGMAPYTAVTNALTFGVYQDNLATEAFQRIAQIKSDENLTEIIRLYRISSEADRARVARILAGLSN